MSGLEVMMVSHSPSSYIWVRGYDFESCSEHLLSRLEVMLVSHALRSIHL